MNTFYDVTTTLLPAFVMITCVILCIHFFQKERIYRYPASNWMRLEDHPIPEDIRGFIATDGQTVDYKYTLNWAPHGKIYFSEYNKTYITHWMPLPDAPKK